MDNPITLYLISGLLALIPAAIWLTVLFRKTKRRSIQILIFAGSIFSVVPVFLIQYFLNLFPQFDVILFLQENIQNQNLNFLFLFIAVGIVEEIVKQTLVRVIDRHYLLIQTINESIQYSLIGALGFSFAENIFYIYSIYTQLGIQQLFVAYLFRSIFTTCAHMIFSGIFGYYYGIAKFSMNIVEQSRWTGKRQRLSTWVGNRFGISTFQAYKQLTILKGALMAIFAHAVFNFLLQFNQLVPVVFYVVIGFFSLLYLLKQRSGKLILISDFNKEGQSTMATKDEDVVIELLGMWFNEKKFVDVIHICQRILQRDPGNKVVELFKAKAIDKLGSNDAYGKILKAIFPDKNLPKSIAAIAKEKEHEKKENTSAPARTAVPAEPSVNESPAGIPLQSPEIDSPPPAKAESGFYDLKL